MEWKKMLPWQMREAVNNKNICILPVGSLERHGEHIPYGCDGGIAEKISYNGFKKILIVNG